MPMTVLRKSWDLRTAADHLRYGVFTAVVLLIIGVSILANHPLRALINTGDELNRAQLILALADRVQLELRQSEVAARNYARDSEAGNLQRYRATSSKVLADFAELRRLTADDPEQQQQLAEIEPLVSEDLALIAVFAEPVSPAFSNSVLFKAQIRRHDMLTDEIGTKIGALSDEERQLYDGRRLAAGENARLAQLAVVGTTGAGALALCGVLYFMTIEIRRRRATEQDLAGLNAQLEDRVRAQTADLTETIERLRRETAVRREAELRLRKLQRELVRASRLTAMGQIGAMIAHELNQPLTANMNYLHGARGLLSTGHTDAAARVPELLEKAQQQAVRAAQVVQRLRDYIGQRETHQAPESLPEMIEDARTLALASTAPGEVSLRINLEPAARTVVVDRAQILQVLVNLVRNAVEAMEGSNRRELTISTALRAEGIVEISVADRGPGLPETVRQQLFTPFVTTKPDGLGIGLSTCQSIVEAHGGRISAAARADGGTVFRFTLHGESPRTPLSAPDSEEDEHAARTGTDD